MKDVALLGFGAVGRHICEILCMKTELAAEIRIVGVADSSAAIYHSNGFAPKDLLQHKAEGPLSTYTDARDGFFSSVNILDLVKQPFAVLVDATPANLVDGNPGLSCAKLALSLGKNVVFANKAPLVLQWEELESLAVQGNAVLRYSATVCGGLPVVNVLKRDLGCARIDKVEGILNSTSNYVLTEISKGNDREAALIEAQSRGIAEANATLDLDGTDAACKLVIIMNTVLNGSAVVALDDVGRTGVDDIGLDDFNRLSQDVTIKLVASATYSSAVNKYILTVKPTQVDKSTLIGSADGTDMCVVLSTDIFEQISLKTNETGVFPTSAAVIRDILDILTPQC